MRALIYISMDLPGLGYICCLPLEDKDLIEAVSRRPPVMHADSIAVSEYGLHFITSGGRSRIVAGDKS